VRALSRRLADALCVLALPVVVLALALCPGWNADEEGRT
jgi:hypothetical protein